ncbi:hypothetical protein GCM10027586_03810 [Kineococcus gypseus]|uniref:hypothetical protein n=1 Tax=Kineococcus gypseus TaxID=1637102 RepID=UPI003D7CD4F9
MSVKVGRPRACGELHGCTIHGRDEGREYVRTDGYTCWKCAICQREHQARYRARLRREGRAA